MKPHRLNIPLFAAALAFACQIPVRADETVTSIKFTDPSKPGTVKVSLGRGELRVQGSDTPEVTIKSDAKAMSNKPRKDGMRVLSAASSFAYTEKDNVVTLDATSNEWGRGGSGDFRLTVPRNTSIVVQNAWGGDVTCTNISGDIEINNMHGEIRLDDISGGVVVGTMNGEIRASIRELQEGKPLSFTSMNGEVAVRLPTTAKANVRLRTQNGTVLTDFDENVLVTKAEAAAYVPRKTAVIKGSGGKVLTTEIQDAIREATQLSATAVKEALEAVKEGLEAARLDNDEARQKFEEAKRDMERARREAEREKRDAERRVASNRGNRNADTPWPAPAAPAAVPAPGAKPVPPAAPMMAKPSMPTITGGKLVTGTLNGGGPEISISTMNGDVIIRKLEAK